MMQLRVFVVVGSRNSFWGKIAGFLFGLVFLFGIFFNVVLDFVLAKLRCFVLLVVCFVFLKSW
jgi:hypothetical protein